MQIVAARIPWFSEIYEVPSRVGSTHVTNTTMSIAKNLPVSAELQHNQCPINLIVCILLWVVHAYAILLL